MCLYSQCLYRTSYMHWRTVPLCFYIKMYILKQPFFFSGSAGAFATACAF